MQFRGRTKRNHKELSAGEPLVNEGKAKLDVSIILPTKNRPRQLRNCLNSIITSSYPYKELIVVDSSDSPIREENEEVVKRLGGKYCFESRHRPAVARNTGIRAASGEIVVIADDDFIVDKDWITNLVKNYTDPELVCCNGRMVSYRNDEMSQLFERIMSFDRGEKRRVFTKKDIRILSLFKLITSIGNRRFYESTPVPWAAGSGFSSFRREIFDTLGYFDEDLGIGKRSSGEDPDMYYRLLKADYQIVYDPTSIIYHDHRTSLEAISRFAYEYGTNKRVFYKKYCRDAYMLVCLLGSMSITFFSFLKALLTRDRNLRQVIWSEIKGILTFRPKE